jgi:hypothetical protein
MSWINQSDMLKNILYFCLTIVFLSSCYYQNKEGEQKRIDELEKDYGTLELDTFYDEDSNYVFQVYTYTNECDSLLFNSDAAYLATELFQAHQESTLKESIGETLMSTDRITKVNVVFANIDYVEFGHYSFDTIICRSSFYFDVDSNDRLWFDTLYYYDKTVNRQGD